MNDIGGLENGAYKPSHPSPPLPPPPPPPPPLPSTLTSRQCKNCNYEYVESLGSTEIGGEFPPGTPFGSLPSNYRCPTCRASKDSFFEVTEEVAGFAVNQGYGFGTNGMTGGEKNTLIFGTLGFLFVLMLGGYGLS